jgi:hypothetical protein
LKLCRCNVATNTHRPSALPFVQEEENIIAENCLTGYDQIIKTKTAQSVVSAASRKSARTETTQSSAASSQASSQHTMGSTKIMRKYVHHPAKTPLGAADVLWRCCIVLTRWVCDVQLRREGARATAQAPYVAHDATMRGGASRLHPGDNAHPLRSAYEHQQGTRPPFLPLAAPQASLQSPSRASVESGTATTGCSFPTLRL